jgi:hypothetical protein|nr:MAG TPA: hypothetical protein [Bacteriophage sp.]
MLAMGSLLNILSYIGFICFLVWLGQLIYLLFTNGTTTLNFATSDIIFVIISMFFSILFGLNGHAHGRLTPIIDIILSIIVYGCMLFGIYSFGIFKGLVLFYILMEIMGYIQRR